MRIQPLCPIRSDARCMGAACAWSRRHVREDYVWVFTCGRVEGEDGLAIVDRVGKDDEDPAERT